MGSILHQVRVLAPELNGVTCVSDAICMEDVTRCEEASARPVGTLARIPFSVRGVVEISGKETSMDRSGQVVTASIGDRGRRLSRNGGAI